MRRYGKPLKQGQIDKMMLEADENNDGEISFEEFLPAAERKLKATFRAMDFEAMGESPWIRIFDPSTGTPFFWNRSSMQMEVGL